MSELEKYRLEINEIDDQLVELFERRMQVARDVGRYKLERNLPVLNLEREKIVIERNSDKVKDPSLKEVTKRFFQAMMDLSKELQEDL